MIKTKEGGFIQIGLVCSVLFTQLFTQTPHYVNMLSGDPKGCYSQQNTNHNIYPRRYLQNPAMYDNIVIGALFSPENVAPG